MRIQIPKFATKKERFDFLLKHKDALIAKKMEGITKSDPFSFSTPILSINRTEATKSKKAGAQKESEHKELDVIVVANTANWCDSQLDVLLPDCWKGTIKRNGPTGKNTIYHLKDHADKTNGVIGKPTKLYSKDFSLRELGLDMDGNTQALCMDSVVKSILDEKTTDLYEEEIIKQHSIGMGYIDLQLALDDKENELYYAVWQKYFDQIINKDVVAEYGFFWAVKEIELYEVSAVLWGANELTPTLEVETASNSEEEKEEQDEFSLVDNIKNFNFFCSSETDLLKTIKSHNFFN